MTTAPVMTITEELLADISRACEDSELYADGEYQTMLPTAHIRAMIAHIRSLEARLDYIERNFIGVQFDYDCGDSISVMAIKISDYVPVCRSAASTIDAAIAQEGQSHE